MLMQIHTATHLCKQSRIFHKRDNQTLIIIKKKANATRYECDQKKIMFNIHTLAVGNLVLP